MKTKQLIAIIPAVFAALALLSCDTNREAEEVAPPDTDTTTMPGTSTPPSTTTTPPPQQQENRDNTIKVPEAELNTPQQPE